MTTSPRRILLLCSSPLMALRISIYLESQPHVDLNSYRGIEGALLNEKRDEDVIIVVSKIGEFDDTARVQQIRSEWGYHPKIILITELLYRKQKIHNRTEINENVYLFWYFQTKDELVGLIEEYLSQELNYQIRRTQQRVHLSAPRAMSAMDRLKPAIVLVASSTGGFAALRKLVMGLPADFRAPIVIAQHIPNGFDSTLQRSLSSLSHMVVELAADGPILKKHIYIAPYDSHVEIKQEEGELFMSLTKEPPVHNLRPAADPLFASASTIEGHRIVAVIMTGMGSDGTAGGHLLKQAGAQILCQDEASSSVWGMARTAVEAGICDQQVNLEHLGNVLFQYTK